MKKREGGFLIAKIHQLSGRIFAKKLKEHNINEINPAQGRILFVLRENETLSIRDLSKKTSLGKSTLTSMLDRLEESGYIKRLHSKEDRRKIMVERTQKDRALQSVYETVSREMTNLFYAGFSDREITAFEKYLSKIHKNLSENENE
ncbi:MAG: MarR family transcriptional regulator [bacterium]|nr:MarR family transcriptional regulator [bacterium]